MLKSVRYEHEPTVGLDPIARDAVWKHLMDLQSNYGTTLFLTTHYLEEAESHCDRLAIMHLGKIAALGTCEEIKATLGGESSTLSEVFTHYAGCAADAGGTFRPHGGGGQVLTMPLFFASNAIYPTAIMPGWRRTISHLNPLTYVVDALRTSMLAGSASTFGLGHDYAVLLITTTVLVLIGARLYPHLAS